MPWQKGISGNAGGGPKITLADGRTLAEVAREHTLKAMDTIIEVMTDPESPSAARVSAASIVLDRGWGRANQLIEHSGRVDEPNYSDPDAAKVSIARYLEKQRKKEAEWAA